MDVTERKKIELALQRSNEDLSQFAHMISHDLQEPLRTVATFT
jgi:light-regulated signal transduction histidine kinase (bacteriophytochrome)